MKRINKYHYVLLLWWVFLLFKWSLILAWHANTRNDIRLRCDYRKYFQKIYWNNISLWISFSTNIYWRRSHFSWILSMSENWAEMKAVDINITIKVISLLYFVVLVSLESIPIKIHTNKMTSFYCSRSYKRVNSEYSNVSRKLQCNIFSFLW